MKIPIVGKAVFILRRSPITQNGNVSTGRHPNNCYITPDLNTPWWRHQMEAFSALLAICTGNSPVFLNKRLSKHSWGWWLDTISRPLWGHSNDWNIIDKPVLVTMLHLWRYHFILLLLCMMIVIIHLWHCYFISSLFTLEINFPH